MEYYYDFNRKFVGGEIEPGGKFPKGKRNTN